jgi:hypothetical protein
MGLLNRSIFEPQNGKVITLEDVWVLQIMPKPPSDN